MKIINSRIRLAVHVFAAVLSIALLGASSHVMAQQMPGDLPPMRGNQNGPQGDPIRQLNLSPEQIDKIRSIREQGKDDRFAANQRLRQAQMALDEAIETENASEALIEQRSRELAEAQASFTRLRALTELRIRRVLTQEQLAKLRTLKQQAVREREERQNQLQEPMRPRDRMQRRRDALQPGPHGRPDFAPNKPSGNPPPNPRP